LIAQVGSRARPLVTNEQKQRIIERAQTERGDGYALFVNLILNMTEGEQGAMAQHLGLHIEVIDDGIMFHRISEVKN
jgi:hypothetical protein